MMKGILKLKGVLILNKNQKKNIAGGGGAEDYLDCRKTSIDVNDSGATFTVHETCCAHGSGTCFDVSYDVD